MGKRTISAFLSIFLAAAVAILAVPVPAQARTDLYGPDLGGWMYVPSTLPEGSEAKKFSTDIYLQFIDWDNYENSKYQYADTATLTFKSGDPALKDALYIGTKTEKVREDNNDEWTEREVLLLCVNNDVLTAPGDAVFHLSAKSKDFTLEEDIPLHVLSWMDYPLLIPREYDQPVTARIGQTLNYIEAENLAVERYNDHMIAELFEGKSGRQLGTEFINDSGALEHTGYETSTVVKSGSWDLVYTFDQYNIHINVTVPMKALPYQIEGPKSIQPGESAEYRMEEEDPGSGRSFTWSLEGEGVSFDAETQTITASEDALASEYTLTAVPSDGGDPAVFFGSVGTGVLAGTELRQDGGCRNGFYAVRPAFPADYTEIYYMNDDIRWLTNRNRDQYLVEVDYGYLRDCEKSCEDPDAARQKYEGSIREDPDEIVEINEEILLDDGHPARIIITRPANEEAESYKRLSKGILLYARNQKMMVASVTITPGEETSWADMPKVELDDMIRIARKIKYDPALSAASLMGCRMSLSVKEGVTAVTAGKKLTFVPSYIGGEEDKQNAAKAPVEWTVTGADGAELPAGVSISKGVLSTGKTDKVEKVVVTAQSAACKDSVSCEVTILPAVNKITLEPAELFFYTGTDAPAEVKAVLDPDTVPPLGITWTPAKAGIVEIIPNEENGTAAIRPLAGGKTTVAVKEPGGKNAKLTVSVVDPVEDVELAVSGKTAPGGTVTVKETILPKTAGNKNVEWTLDVGEDIATVSKGKVKISKNAPIGTVITVTCTALGAPEPVVRTAQIEVTEK